MGFFIFFINKKLYIFVHMKKYVIILALSVTTTLMSCGSGSTTNEMKDSTVNQNDSTDNQVDSTTVDTTKSTH